ncbi:MAG: DUF5659 domain-containing protein [Candidatus Shapirobacteria bacterium]|nr:DUF5659 domain-containing protein [Candidatus Shapirobacteria bacterium]
MENICKYEYLFESKDLAESSFLLAKGKILESIEREGSVCWFVFQDKESCEDLVRKFRFGDSTIQAKKFYEAIQTLKKLIFPGGNRNDPKYP